MVPFAVGYAAGGPPSGGASSRAGVGRPSALSLIVGASSSSCTHGRRPFLGQAGPINERGPVMRKNDRSANSVTTVAGSRAHRRSLRVLTVVGIVGVGLSTGCSIQDRVCSPGEYPVKAVGNTTGGACQPDGEEPPGGYVRYPEGKVPEYVGDKWDNYWKTKIVDSEGNIVAG